MKDAIEKYFTNFKGYSNSLFCDNLDEISKDIKENISKGIMVVDRTELTNIDLFEKEFGYKLPKEIEEYINIFWHPYIIGYLSISECIILFSVLKKNCDNCDNILFYEDGLITLSRKWSKIGNIQQFLPIGWLGYSGGYVLYEVETGRIFIEDIDADTNGQIQEIPIANSLKELINNLKTEKIKMMIS